MALNGEKSEGKDIDETNEKLLTIFWASIFITDFCRKKFIID
jgi:hypothetical protein